MRNPRSDIFKALVELLDGNIVYEGVNVPVFSGHTPERTPLKFVQIGSIITSERGLKDAFGHTGSFDIQIIDESGANQSSPAAVESITSAVLELLKPNIGSVLGLTNFDMIYMTIPSTIAAPNIFGTNVAYTNIIQCAFEVIEKRGIVWILATGNWNDDGTWDDDSFWNDGI